MSMTDIENLRYAQTRGKILVILAEDYRAAMTSTGNLVSALDLLGYSISDDSLIFHLRYLEDSGYVKIWRTQDMAGYRRDRLTGGARPEDIRFVRLLPAGLQLIDGVRTEDPMVKF